MIGQEKMSGGRYYLTDCIDAGEYLIIEDGQTSIGKI